MTEFAARPYERIYVRDVIRVSQDDLVAMMSTLEAASGYWVDGVLLASFAMSESEELAKKEMQDEMYLDKIVFCRCDRYSRTVKSSTNLEIGVLDMSGSRLYREMVAWLKTLPAWQG